MNGSVIIADDLTGASDTGIKLHIRGYETSVVFNPESLRCLPDKNKILSINTSSREDEPEIAYQKVFQLTQILKKNGFNKIYKKIDSVIRGNIGTEIDAVMEALDVNTTFLVPAIPNNGRSVVDSYLYIKDSIYDKIHIPKILEKSSNSRIESISLKDIRKGKALLLYRIYELVKEEKLIILFDTEKEDDLEIISQAIKEYNHKFVLAGASGMANFLPEIWSLNNSDYRLRILDNEKSHLIIAGSYNMITGIQIKSLIDNFNCNLLKLDTQRIIKNKDLINYMDEIKLVIENVERPKIIVIAVDTLISHEINPIKSDGKTITEFISEIAKLIIEKNICKTITITGGETAYSVMTALGSYGMQLIDEIVNGLPVGTILGGMAEGIPLVTKSGGFGQDDALIEVINYFKKSGKEVVLTDAI